MNRRIILVLACLFPISAGFGADDGIPAKKLQDLKAATVYVKVEGKEGTTTGSGFLIRVDGETGVAVTNHHVIEGVPGVFTPDKVALVFWSGTKKERILPAEILAVDPDRDLAVLKVTGKDLPAPFDLTQKTELRETMTVYTLGFPLGDLLAPARRNPSVTIGKGTVSRLQEDESGRITTVQLDAELNPGNSGGPVVDSAGKLVGIAVAKVGGTKISFAIPPAELNSLLNGRVGDLVIRSVRLKDGVAELALEVPCLDPLGKIKTLAIRHVRKDATKTPEADKNGQWAELPGSDKIDLKIQSGVGRATLTLKAPEKRTIDYLFQAVYSNGDSKQVVTPPLTRAINFATGTVGALWEIVSSKEGQFSIEMPVKPNLSVSRTRRGPGGTVRVLMLGCQTKSASYLAVRADFPSAIPRGAEERYLDYERDEMAKDFHGKVVREKRVRAEGRLGRDFTIRGRPIGQRGFLTIRVREYLVGKSVFAVMVVSAPNRDLPEDAGKFLGSLALGANRTRAAGGPEPEPTGKELTGWGLAIDPDKDCKFEPTAKSLGITAPGTLHDLNPDSGQLSAPRVVRTVDGDFQMTVKVTGDFQPGGKSTNPRGVPYNGGGLLVWSDSDNFIRLERGAMLRGGKVLTYIAFEEREGGYRGAVHNQVFKAGACYLRLERKASRILGAVSTDGTNWKQLQPIDTLWPSKLKVGLAAINSSTEPFSVRFEEFTLQADSTGADGTKKNSK